MLLTYGHTLYMNVYRCSVTCHMSPGLSRNVTRPKTQQQLESSNCHVNLIVCVVAFSVSATLFLLSPQALQFRCRWHWSTLVPLLALFFGGSPRSHRI